MDRKKDRDQALLLVKNTLNLAGHGWHGTGEHLGMW